MRYVGVLLLLPILGFASCTKKKDFKEGIVQLQSRPVLLSLEKMRCMWNGKDTLIRQESLLAKIPISHKNPYITLFY